MKLPTHEECFGLIKKYKMLPNILEHSLMVNKVAMYLAKKLKAKGIKINLDLVDRASLLHDIAKSVTIKQKVRGVHHEVGEEILIKEGFPEVGKVVKMHSLKELKNLSDWEDKIVNYADLRVRHNQIVNLRERIDDLNERYNIVERDRVPEKFIFELEKEIFDAIGESPETINKESIK